MSEPTFDEVRSLQAQHPDPVEARLIVEDGEREIWQWPGYKVDIIRRLIEKLKNKEEEHVG